MFYSHDVCVAWARLRLIDLELAVHVDIKSVVHSSRLILMGLWSLPQNSELSTVLDVILKTSLVDKANLV